MQSKFKLSINEDSLRQLVRESFYNNQILNENQGHFIKTDLDIARQVVTEINWKGAALGAMMGASVLGGMQSCSPINPATQNNTEMTQNGGHIDWPDYSDRPWAFEGYIGSTVDAIVLSVQDKYLIKKLVLNNNVSTEQMLITDFQDCAWAISYETTERRDQYNVDIYHTHGQPLFDKQYDGVYYDGEAYFELWYTQDETKTMNERVQFIKVYRRKEDKQNTTWTIKLDYAKQNHAINIANR